MNHPHRVLPEIDGLPHALYLAEQVKHMDDLAINAFGIPAEALMERAGSFTFDKIRQHWPEASDITVLCGTGNNGGDGYVVARLAREAGMTVRILQLGDPKTMNGPALRKAERRKARRTLAEEKRRARTSAAPKPEGVQP